MKVQWSSKRRSSLGDCKQCKALCVSVNAKSLCAQCAKK